MRTLWASVAGSHAWKMATPSSDIDIVEVVIDDTKDIFIGKGMSRPKVYNQDSKIEPSPEVKKLINDVGQGGWRKDKYDVTQMEIGHLCDQLKKGNINAMWAVMSPIHTKSEDLEKLKGFVQLNLSVVTWKSVKGCVLNLADKNTDKKLKVAMRMIMQFYTMMDEERVVFDPVVETPSLETIQELVDSIDLRILKGDNKIERPIDEQDFDNYLLLLREDNYDKEQEFNIR